ncbi:MAG: glycosyltransferase family 39 protein [Parvularculaceae bacterium]
MSRFQGVLHNPALAIALVAMFAGFSMRLADLGGPSLSHPEIYIPGIDLPAGISEPPPRHGFLETLDWHFNEEPHPVGYYMAMRVWTAIAGTSPTALRLPGAFAGSLTILAVFFLARALYGNLAAALSALMIAASGFHIFWSQIARMYAPGALFCVVSTYFLMRLMRDERPSEWAGWGYGLAIVLSLQTTEMCWLILAVQMLFVALNGDAAMKARDIVPSPMRWRVPRAAYVQGLALIASMPALAHSLYQARGEAAPAAGAEFLRNFLSFGFLFYVDADAPHSAHPGAVIIGAAFAAGLALCAIGFFRPPKARQTSLVATAPVWPLYFLAFASSALIFWFSTFATKRADLLSLMAPLPFFMILAPLAAAFFRPLLRSLSPPADRLASYIAARTTIVSWIVAAPVVLGLILFGRAGLFAPRAFVVFVPFVIILAAAGLAALASKRALFAAAALGVAAIFADGLVINASRTPSPRDYKATAAALSAILSPGDYVLTHYRDWADTPLFYYFDRSHVIAAYGEDPLDSQKRVWTIRWKDLEREALDKRMSAALRNFNPVEKIETPDAEFTLYERDPN